MSSKTVFMFSIHKASIGPSKMTHFLVSVWSAAYSRNVFAQTPSVHYKSGDVKINSHTKLHRIFYLKPFISSPNITKNLGSIILNLISQCLDNFNHLNANITKWSNTLIQFFGKLLLEFLESGCKVYLI